MVTGAAGMVGQNLVPRLVARGHKVIAIDKSGAALKVLGQRAPAADRHVADLAEEGSWGDLFSGADTVVDLKAQITSPDRALHIRNNSLATSRVLAACERHAVPYLIHLSSSVVVSRAADFYTETKRLGEEAVRASRTKHTILRPPLMFGPGDIKHLGLILRLMKVLPLIPLPGDGRFIRQPLYVGDLCAVIETCLDRPPDGGTFNIIGHDRIAFVDLLRQIRAITRSRCVFVPLPIALFRVVLGVQQLFRRTIFTTEQLDALTAGDDFPVENWSEVFGVPFTPFQVAAPRVYSQDDDLRVSLLAALNGEEPRQPRTST